MQECFNIPKSRTCEHVATSGMYTRSHLRRHVCCRSDASLLVLPEGGAVSSQMPSRLRIKDHNQSTRDENQEDFLPTSWTRHSPGILHQLDSGKALKTVFGHPCGEPLVIISINYSSFISNPSQSNQALQQVTTVTFLKSFMDHLLQAPKAFVTQCLIFATFFLCFSLKTKMSLSVLLLCNFLPLLTGKIQHQ